MEAVRPKNRPGPTAAVSVSVTSRFSTKTVDVQIELFFRNRASFNFLSVVWNSGISKNKGTLIHSETLSQFEDLEKLCH